MSGPQPPKTLRKFQATEEEIAEMTEAQKKARTCSRCGAVYRSAAIDFRETCELKHAENHSMNGG
jgi:hypothetical protein